MGLTPVYGFPYPALTDSPNGPAQIQALAEAVEADLQTTDANVTALTAAGLTYARFVGGTQRSSDTGTITGETVFSTSGSLSLAASSVFLVRGRADFFTSVPGDRFDFRFRETNIGGTVVREVISNNVDAAGVPMTFEWAMFYKTAGSETKTWVATVSRFAGTGNIVCQGGSSVAVFYLGASTLLGTSNP